jgi:hypothetical protein
MFLSTAELTTALSIDKLVSRMPSTAAKKAPCGPAIKKHTVSATTVNPKLYVKYDKVDLIEVISKLGKTTCTFYYLLKEK